MVLQHVRPSTDTGPPFLYGYSEKPAQLVAFCDTLGIRGHILDLTPGSKRGFEFIDVLRHMQQYFSHICDGTDVQAD